MTGWILSVLSPRIERIRFQSRRKFHVDLVQSVLLINVIPTAASEFRLRWLSVHYCSACNTSWCIAVVVGGIKVLRQAEEITFPPPATKTG